MCVLISAKGTSTRFVLCSMIGKPASSRLQKIATSWNLIPETELSVKARPSLSRTIKGKIDYVGMVRGKTDPKYLRLLFKYASLDPSFDLRHPPVPGHPHGQYPANIYTEGTTDGLHITAALARFQAEGEYNRIRPVFATIATGKGKDQLLAACRTYASSPTCHPTPQLFMFDTDDEDVLKRAHLRGSTFYNWGNNVFSLALPTPAHRHPSQPVCIELLYQDGDIKRLDPGVADDCFSAQNSTRSLVATLTACSTVLTLPGRSTSRSLTTGFLIPVTTTLPCPKPSSLGLSNQQSQASTISTLRLISGHCLAWSLHSSFQIQSQRHPPGRARHQSWAYTCPGFFSPLWHLGRMLIHRLRRGG